jgi:hypothetical protein
MISLVVVMEVSWRQLLLVGKFILVINY